MKYSKKYIFKESDLDEHGNILPSRVLMLFQDLATAHAEQLGVGFDAMLERGQLWVVTQIRYEVFADVKAEACAELSTWPLPPTRIGYERQYLISDENGKPLIKGTSNWVVIDCKERKLVSAGNVYPSDDFCVERNFDKRIRKFRDFEADSETLHICPDEACIDRNGHVNNTEYAKLTVKALGGLIGKLSAFQIDYIHEIMCGQKIGLNFARQDEAVLVKGISESGERMFTCSMEYKA
ncbi:MAG: hypothetical protein E7491_02390 [Ruminococcaceae bacterium]|nr:hypothetical protein [Oscillospiraceae bacterium]